MYKSLILIYAVCLVIIEARPKWQYLPAVPGYVPVYIRNGDTPLEEINPELAEAFHALPAGRSAGKLLEAAPETPDLPENPRLQEQPDLPQLDPAFGPSDSYENKSSAEVLKPEQIR